MTLLGSTGIYHGPDGPRAALVVDESASVVHLAVFSIGEEGGFAVRPAFGVIIDPYGHGYPLSFSPQPPLRGVGP